MIRNRSEYVKALNNLREYRAYNIEGIASVNAQFARAFETKVKTMRQLFAQIYAGVRRDPGQDDARAVSPELVHAVKQELGYTFCDAHAQEVNALFDALVNLRRVQQTEIEKQFNPNSV